MNNSLINPIRAKISEKYLYDMDATKTSTVKCKIVGVSAYVGMTLSFHVLLDDGSIFSNVPVFAFILEGTLNPLLTNSDLAYCNCPHKDAVEETIEKEVFYNDKIRHMRLTQSDWFDFFKNIEEERLMER